MTFTSIWSLRGVFRDLQVCSESRKPPFNRLKIVYKVGIQGVQIRMYTFYSELTVKRIHSNLDTLYMKIFHFFAVLRGSGYAGSHRGTLGCLKI